MPEPVAVGLLEAFSPGLGFQDFKQVASPAAGATATFTVESNNWVRILAATGSLSTDANAANRVFSIDFINARGNTYVRNFWPGVITANTATTAFHWTEQVTDSEWAANTPVKVPVSSIFLPPATSVKWQVDNIQVGDQLTALTLTLERFDTGLLGYGIGYVPAPSVATMEALPKPAPPPKPEQEATIPPFARQG